DGRVKFFPPRYANTYLDWLAEKRDWCISRQLWWGHRIPVWSRQDWDHAHASAELKAFGRQLSKWSGEGRIAMRKSNIDAQHFNLPAAVIDPASNLFRICILREDDLEVVRELEARDFTQETDVLDTWFSSQLWP